MKDIVRVVQYVNQFFGQIGGEEKASTGPEVKDGPIGVGVATQNALGDKGQVVATVICGDNYFAEHFDEAIDTIVDIIAEYDADLVIAGPAFLAGRYGVACGSLCKAVQERLQIPSVTGMHIENPGVDLYREDVFIIETGDSAKSMQRDVQRMVAIGLKLVAKEPIGRPEQEGYISRGLLVNVLSDRTAAERAVDMLLALLKGEEIKPELKLASFDKVNPAPPLKDLKRAKIALITDGGLVPAGNPDKLEWMAATKYVTVDLSDRDTLSAGEFYANHTGYDTTEVNANPLRLVPFDVMRELEEQGVIKKLHPKLYSTTGVATTVEYSQRIGKAIAEELEKEGIDAVILTST